MPRKFYFKNTKEVAQGLLGKILVYKTENGVLSGKIIETEAYYGEEDSASHAYRGKTTRNAVMYGPPGHSYVYFTYGMHYMLNIVTELEGRARAVLIRALEPLEGIEIMKKQRRTDNTKNLCSGPAKLTQAMVISRKDNGLDITKGKLVICEGKKEKFDIANKPRIGVRDKQLLRFYIKGNEFVSKK